MSKLLVEMNVLNPPDVIETGVELLGVADATEVLDAATVLRPLDVVDALELSDAEEAAFRLLDVETTPKLPVVEETSVEPSDVAGKAELLGSVDAARLLDGVKLVTGMFAAADAGGLLDVAEDRKSVV